MCLATREIDGIGKVLDDKLRGTVGAFLRSAMVESIEVTCMNIKLCLLRLSPFCAHVKDVITHMGLYFTVGSNIRGLHDRGSP